MAGYNMLEEAKAEAKKIKEAAVEAGTWPGKTGSNTEKKASITVITEEPEKKEEKKTVVPEVTETEEVKPEAPAVPETQEQPDSQTKAEEAKKKLEDYRNSEEKKKNAEKRLQDKYAQQLLYGITDSSEVLYDEDPREKELQAEADYWENKVKQEADEKLFAANMQEIQNLSGAERTAFENYANNRTFVDPENLEAYKRLKERYGDKLNDLKYTYQRDKEEKAAREMAEKTAAKMDQGGALADIGRNVLGIGARLLGGITGTAGRINEMVNGTGPYQTAAKYTYGDVPSVYGKTVLDKTSEQILAGQDLNISDGISGRELGAIAYQGGMSALDTGARLLASFGNPFIAASMAASQTFSSTVQEATEKGATPQEAYALATVSAGIEALTEKLPLDNLVSIAKGGANPKLIVNLLLQAGVEIGEEEASLIGTTLAEMAILKEKSGYQQSIQKAAAMGVPYEQAVAEADRALLEEAKQTALISGFSGLLSAGGAEGRNRLLGGSQSQQDSAQQPAAVQQEQNQPPQEQAAQPAQPVQEAQEQPTATAQGAKPEAPAQQQKAEPDGAEQTFRELDAKRKSEKDRQQRAYESLKAEQRKQAQLEKQIANAEQKLQETGKGSQARIDQMKQELETQKGIVEGKQKFLDYFGGGYDTNIESAIQTQQDLFENAKMQVSLAIADYNDGRISEAQLEDAKKTYNDAGAELYRLKNMTQEQYRAELASIGLLGDMVKTAQPAQETQTAPAAGKHAAPNTIDVLTETITGRPAAAPQTSTQQVDTQNQSVESGQIKGTGAAEQNFSGVAEYENMLYDGNIQKQRAGAVRDVEMPQTDPEGRRVSSLASNAVSSAVTPDRMVDAIKSLVNDRELSFDTRSNQQSLDNAAEAIRQAGEEKTINELAKHAENKTIVDGDVEKGLVLYAQYANDPNAQEKASEIFTNLAAVANMSGRNLQLFGLLKRMTPEGQLMTVRKEISKSIEKINKSRHGKNQITVTFGEKDIADAKKAAQKRNVQVDKALEQNFLDAKTIEEKKQALDDIYKDVAAKIKPTLGEMYDEWRNLAMLGSLKTHERNVGATAAFQPFVMVKRAIGSALESAILKQEDRTKSIVGFGKDDRALVKWARGDAKSDDIKKLLGGSGFAGNEARDTIHEYRKILPGFLDTLSKGNQNVMGAEDTFFKRGEYAASLASFLKARGYSIEQVQEGSVPKGIMDEGRQIAIKEAQKATFNDRNKLTNLVEKLNNAGEEYGGSVFHALSKGAVAFLRTTTNIVKRASEYSFDPVSIGKTLITAKADIDSGKKSGADVIDEISARLTGGAAMALGAGLAAGMIPGVELVGEIEDEDELREGAVEYSIRIGDKYYPVGWLAPAMIPLFIGANLYGKFSNWDEDADGWDLVEAYIDTMKGALNPLLELSMLSSINDMIDAVKYEEKPGGKVVAAVMNLATSYFTQSIPTVFGQVEQAFEKDRKTAYVNTGNTAENIVKRTIANATKRLPGDAYQTEKLDEFGQPVKNDGDPLKRVVDAFLNPFNTSERKTDAVTKEITRLNRANVGKVKLSEPSKKITYTDINGNEHEDVRLTEEQYQTMARTQGDTEKRIMERVIESDVYKAMTDRQKADLMDIIDDYAREAGRTAALPDYDGMADWMKDITEENEVKTIIGKAVVKGFDSAFSDIVDDWNRGNDPAKSIEALDQAYKNYKAMPEADRLEFVQNDKSRVGDYIRARNMGVDAETYAELYKTYRSIEGTNKSINDKAHDWANVLEKAVDNGTLTERQKSRMKSDMKFYYNFAADTAKYDQMISAGVGTNVARKMIEVMGATGDSNKEKYAAISGISATDETKDAIMKVYMTDFDPNAKKVDTTELKYDYIRKEMGLSPSQFSTAYAINNDGGKWKDRASKMSKQLNISKDEAYDLIQIFEGQKKDMLLDWYKQQ